MTPHYPNWLGSAESEGCVVTWLNDIDSEPAEEPEGKRRVAFTIVGALVLAVVGSGSAFAWHSYAGAIYPSFALGSSSAVATEPKTVAIEEFQAFQQQITGQMQAN